MSLMGESRFSPDVLAPLIEKKGEVDETDTNRRMFEQNIKRLVEEHSDKRLLKDIVINWKEWIYSLLLEEKKVLLRKLINQITVYRDCIDIELNQTLNEFVSEYKRNVRFRRINKGTGFVKEFVPFFLPFYFQAHKKDKPYGLSQNMVETTGLEPATSCV